MGAIVIAERTGEEKKETEENRLVVTAANMLLLDSNAGFPLLHSRSHTVTETIIRRPKEENVRLTKEETSITQVFVMVALSLSPSLLPLSSMGCRPILHQEQRQIIWMYIYIYIYIYIFIYVCLLEGSLGGRVGG
jgi:hypothetical protein